MSAFLLDHIESAMEGTNTSVAYFFCDDKEQLQKSAQSLLRGVIHQLITATPSLIKHAMRNHMAHGSKMLESLDLLWNIFIFAATDPLSDGTYIILDALDECEKHSRDDLFRRLGSYFLPEVKKSRVPYLKVIITSRPYREIQLLLSKHRTIRLKTEDEGSNISADISSFIWHKVEEMAEICHYNSELKEKVRAKLETGADGMFLWVSLVVEELLDTPANSVIETLETTPDSVNGVYSHLLKRLDGRKAMIAKKILMWIVMAPEPMTVTDLAWACSINNTDESRSSVGQDLITGFKHDIALCGPMVGVKGGVVYLVHQSAKDFLLNPDLRDSLGGFSVIPERANLELAITCLTFLSFLEYWSTSIWGRPQAGMAFYEFALKLWPRFAEEADEGHPRIWQVLCRFTKRDKQLYLPFRDDEFQVDEWLPALYISAYFGFYSISRRLLESGVYVDASGGWFCQALQAAVARGHYRVVLLLLENGADVNRQGGHYRSPFHAAVARGDERIIILLLENGADIDGPDWDNDTPLTAAIKRGHEWIVILLLGNGADINGKAGSCRIPLTLAAEQGHEGIVILLLENGADVNGPDWDDDTPLTAAIKGGHERMVILLLGRGADINQHCGLHGTALIVAARGGNERIVLLLLENGADVNALDGDQCSALRRAQEQGELAVINVLFQHVRRLNLR